MGYIFDGINKRIVLDSIGAFTVVDLYSRWKDWVQLSDNSKYVPAFRSVAGDPVGGGQSLDAHIFLNNEGGWRIRPFEANHTLVITGNLWPENASLPLTVPTLGGFVVLISLRMSSSALAVETGSGLSAEQTTQLAELYRLAGLDVTKPLVVGLTSRKVPADGSIINQTINDALGVVTVTRT